MPRGRGRFRKHLEVGDAFDTRHCCWAKKSSTCCLKETRSKDERRGDKQQRNGRRDWYLRCWLLVLNCTERGRRAVCRDSGFRCELQSVRNCKLVQATLQRLPERHILCKRLNQLN